MLCSASSIPRILSFFDWASSGREYHPFDFDLHNVRDDVDFLPSNRHSVDRGVVQVMLPFNEGAYSGVGSCVFAQNADGLQLRVLSQPPAARLLSDAMRGYSPIALASDICASLISTMEFKSSLGYRPESPSGVASGPNKDEDDAISASRW